MSRTPQASKLSAGVAGDDGARGAGDEAIALSLTIIYCSTVSRAIIFV